MERRPNTVMDLTATFAACAAVPRTCFRMSAAHHHVGGTSENRPFEDSVHLRCTKESPSIMHAMRALTLRQHPQHTQGGSSTTIPLRFGAGRRPCAEVGHR